MHAQERRAVAQQLHDALGRALLLGRRVLARRTLGPAAPTSGRALAPGRTIPHRRAISPGRTVPTRWTATTAAAAAGAAAGAGSVSPGRPVILGRAILRGRLLLGVPLVGVLGRSASRAASANARTPAPFVGGRRLLGVPFLGVRTGGATTIGRSRRGAPRGGGFAEDRVDQIGLAQPAKPFEAELVGDRVQVGQRAGLQLGAVEYCHVYSPSHTCGGRLAPGRVVAQRPAPVVS